MRTVSIYQLRLHIQYNADVRNSSTHRQPLDSFPPRSSTRCTSSPRPVPHRRSWPADLESQEDGGVDGENSDSGCDNSCCSTTTHPQEAANTSEARGEVWSYRLPSCSSSRRGRCTFPQCLGPQRRQRVLMMRNSGSQHHSLTNANNDSPSCPVMNIKMSPGGLLKCICNVCFTAAMT